MKLTIEIDREDDGRWIGEVMELPGVLTYGQTREEAISRVQALALRVLADRIEHGEEVPEVVQDFLEAHTELIPTPNLLNHRLHFEAIVRIRLIVQSNHLFLLLLFLFLFLFLSQLNYYYYY